MNYKKLLKYIILFPVLLAVGALLYLMLLLGEADESTSNNILPKQTMITQPIGNMSLQNASLDDILLRFDGAMLVKSSIPDSLELTQSGSNGNYIYTLRAVYRLPDGRPYNITAQRPISAMQNRNVSGMTLHAEKAISFAGMMGAWLEDKHGIYLSGNSETAAYLITFPKLSEQDIITELSTLSLNR